MTKFIGLGNWSKYYLYILGTVICKCIRDCMFGFNTINPESKIGLFGFIPELSNHFIIQALYRYGSFILGGSLFTYIVLKNSKNESQIKEKQKKINENLDVISLIHNKKTDGSEYLSKGLLIKVCLIYCIHSELSRIMYIFDFGNLDFWTVDVIFILLFMDIYFEINYHKHQKFSMGFIIVSVTILLVISSFLPFTNHDDVEDLNIKDNNAYQIIEDMTGNNYSFIIILLIFFSLSCLLSYGRVQEKVLMDCYYLSPYKLILFIGIFGFVITSIILTITTIFNCPDDNEFIKAHCYVTKEEDNIKKYYYDNLLIYFEELKNNTSSYKFYLEVILIPPLYLIINFLEFTCEILTIYYFNPNYISVRDNIYYGTSRLIFFLFNLNKNYKHYMTLTQFILLETAEICALFGYGVYLELIELRFFGLDKDLKKNIIKRGIRDTSTKPIYSSNDDDNNNNNNNNSKDSYDESFLEEEKKNNDNNSDDNDEEF